MGQYEGTANKQQIYLKAGTGYDCAGQNKEIEAFMLTIACLNWLSILILGATLPTGSRKRFWLCSLLKDKIVNDVCLNVGKRKTIYL